MRTVERFDLKTPARFAGYLLVGGLGTIALTLPLFGFLGYWAGLLLPLLLAWFVAGAVLALTRPGRAAQKYLFGNLGMLAATLGAWFAVWIRLVISGEEPNPAVAAPLYLALVLAGLVVGLVVGARRRMAQP